MRIRIQRTAASLQPQRMATCPKRCTITRRQRERQPVGRCVSRSHNSESIVEVLIVEVALRRNREAVCDAMALQAVRKRRVARDSRGKYRRRASNECRRTRGGGENDWPLRTAIRPHSSSFRYSNQLHCSLSDRPTHLETCGRRRARCRNSIRTQSSGHSKCLLLSTKLTYLLQIPCNKQTIIRVHPRSSNSSLGSLQ